MLSKKVEDIMDNDYKYEIGLRLRQIRKERNMTQEKLSEALGISQKHYSEVERGITGLSIKNFIQISEIMNVSLDYILKGTLPKNTFPTQKINVQINELFYESSEFTQKQMLRLLNIAKEIEKNAIEKKNT